MNKITHSILKKITAMNKITLHLNQSLPFASNVPIAELDPDRIRCNDIVFPWERHPYKMGLWVIGNEFGALGAVWADCEQDAFDELVDAGLGDGLLIEETDATEDCTRLGNAGEPANLDHAWLARVEWDNARDFSTLMKFAEARGANHDNLGQL